MSRSRRLQTGDLFPALQPDHGRSSSHAGASDYDDNSRRGAGYMRNNHNLQLLPPSFVCATRDCALEFPDAYACYSRAAHAYPCSGVSTSPTHCGVRTEIHYTHETIRLRPKLFSRHSGPIESQDMHCNSCFLFFSCCTDDLSPDHCVSRRPPMTD
jgi:hypothetical protein